MLACNIVRTFRVPVFFNLLLFFFVTRISLVDDLEHLVRLPAGNGRPEKAIAMCYNCLIRCERSTLYTRAEFNAAVSPWLPRGGRCPSANQFTADTRRTAGLVPGLCRPSRTADVHCPRLGRILIADRREII